MDVYAALLVSSDRRIKPFTDSVRVTMSAYPPDKRKRDLDNLPKAIFDALTHVGVWDDDSLVDDFRIRREEVQKPGLVRVEIEEMAR